MTLYLTVNGININYLMKEKKVYLIIISKPKGCGVCPIVGDGYIVGDV
jgi:hypothetical protein